MRIIFNFLKAIPINRFVVNSRFLLLGLCLNLQNMFLKRGEKKEKGVSSKILL
jgi:hypothetical protein